jgi:signal transduction histidine kinase/CheY-like chemotaxis protein
VKDLIPYVQNIGAFAFLVLGVATALGWWKHRERSTGWLALAIVLLASVSIAGRIQPLFHISVPLLPQLSLVAFMACAYALLRYRGSLIPLSRVWHVAAVVALTATTAGILVVQSLVAAKVVGLSVETWVAVPLIVVWFASVLEPIVRLWIVSRGLPPVQAWRLRSLSLGFAGIVAVLLFAISAGALATNAAVQVAINLVVLVIVPLLYVSFAPPGWLRREWRASEEEGLRTFMEDLLLLNEDRDLLANRALEWAMRLVGGEAAVAFDGDGTPLASRGVGAAELEEIGNRLLDLRLGISRETVGGAEATILVLPITSLGAAGRLFVKAGPFTPGFGADEVNRMQQFMSAVAATLDRARLLVKVREANAHLQEANMHKSVFLASMSHELRTPLNAILGFSELLIDAPNGQFPPATRKRFLEQIHTSGKHLLGLINDILDLSKIEAGQMELRLQTTVVAEVVQQVAATVEPLAASKKIQIEIGDVDAGHIVADPSKFRQMLLNLASNAIKFTPEGGHVKITAARLIDTVEVSVADTGIGIAPEDLERVFHEFQQVDSGIGRQQQGTGLGLALTRRFVNLHGGSVRVQSEVGRGSVFTISLPLEAIRADGAKVATVAAVLAGPGDALRPLVLVVEDDPAAAELLSRQLERAGFRTEIARTGTEALIRAAGIKPAAITLDILLPDLDGWEVLTRLKRDEATSDIPVVIVSVVDNPELGVALGALDYFVKPVPAKELINRLTRFRFKRKNGHKIRVLVADDEEANRDWLKRVLEPAGFTVLVATGGQEAIAMTKAQMPDLVMLDLMMPNVTGFDVVEALRADAATKAMPIMILTAKHLTEEDIHQLNGHVSTILSRGSTGATDLLGLLRQVVDATTVAV